MDTVLFNLRELESHLRDGVADLKTKGLTEEEAFVLATRRLGKVDVIATEFEKGDPANIWRTRLFWMLAGVVAMNLISNGVQIASIALNIIVRDAVGPVMAINLNEHSLFLPVIWTLATPAALYFLCKWFLRGQAESLGAKFASMRRSRARFGATIASLMIGTSVAQYVLSIVQARMSSMTAFRDWTINGNIPNLLIAWLIARWRQRPSRTRFLRSRDGALAACRNLLEDFDAVRDGADHEA